MLDVYYIYIYIYMCVFKYALVYIQIHRSGTWGIAFGHLYVQKFVCMRVTVCVFLYVHVMNACL
jgi:hypothetical protein